MKYFKIIACSFVVFFICINLISHEGSASDGEVTLKEAIDIGLERAKEWNENAALTRLTSVDEKMGGTRGETGKRYRWTMTFIVPGTDDYVIIGISEKKIAFFLPGQQTPDTIIPYDEIKLDSPDVLQWAKDIYDLQQGKDWATGYNFTLDSIDGKPILTVFGNDPNSRFATVSFNAQNGEVVSAGHKLPYGGGLLSKRNGTDNLTKKGMAITGVVAGNSSLVVWGDKKPTQFGVAKQPFIECSQNNGETWTELQADIYVTYAWFDSNDRLYVATEKELWAGVTTKSKGTKILSLEEPIEKVDTSMNNHIVVLANGKIYYTTNQGKSWEQAIVPKPIYDVQISDNGDLVVSTEESKILRKTNDGWNEITMPDRNDVPRNMKVIHNRLFILMKSEIWIRDLQEGNWSKIQVDETIVALVKKREKLFGIQHRGVAIYAINEQGESKSEKVFDAEDSIVIYDMDSMGDTLWIATAPDYSWEEMPILQRR
ncbi:hypothetical protein PGH26_13010 [Sporosarcina jeotgali]|uniref:Photosynthesis system II assembly factor Ycf48/Hcf136-like domain-containing protein n=1 Tax=Sporosarcina jeotgali TaxID=3020056 RepID=A0ABZ0KTM9_9BACL|nr:hypothetical protein [Sporosarcina sp. B2O-1]WOV83785.1 hypothetical protein PGH26_13010 [Sporosarcina sp. B2O-1]